MHFLLLFILSLGFSQPSFASSSCDEVIEHGDLIHEEDSELGAMRAIREFEILEVRTDEAAYKVVDGLGVRAMQSKWSSVRERAAKALADFSIQSPVARAVLPRVLLFLKSNPKQLGRALDDLSESALQNLFATRSTNNWIRLEAMKRLDLQELFYDVFYDPKENNIDLLSALAKAIGYDDVEHGLTLRASYNQAFVSTDRSLSQLKGIKLSSGTAEPLLKRLNELVNDSSLPEEIRIGALRTVETFISYPQPEFDGSGEAEESISEMAQEILAALFHRMDSRNMFEGELGDRLLEVPALLSKSPVLQLGTIHLLLESTASTEEERFALLRLLPGAFVESERDSRDYQSIVVARAGYDEKWKKNAISSRATREILYMEWIRFLEQLINESHSDVYKALARKNRALVEELLKLLRESRSS